MYKVLGGYTILEVMIFLVVSASLLASAAVVIGGSQGHTQFRQGIYDLNSKMSAWISNVTSGFPGGANRSYSCILGGNGRPQISSPPTASTTPDCVFIGKAIQFSDVGMPSQAQTVYAYSIFGRRTNAAGDQLSANLIEANPIAATATYGSGNVDLTETYGLTGGVKVLSLTMTGTGGSSSSGHLAGFFLDFNTGNSGAQNGNTTLNAYRYRLNSNATPADSSSGATVANCLQLASGSGCEKPAGTPDNAWPENLKSWQVCLGNDTNSDKAVLSITSSPVGLGAQTKVEFKDCS